VGKATIVENLGKGKYRAQLKYDLRALEKTLAALKAQRDDEAMVMIRALLALSELESAKVAAKSGLDAVVDQWMSGLIAKYREAPPLIVPDEPNDPETGAPWADPDRAQDDKLLAAINAARSAAGAPSVTRNAKLDSAIRSHLLYLARSHRVTHAGEDGSNPADRARQGGYLPLAGAGECLAFGQRSASAAVARWKISDAPTLLDPAYTDVGVSFRNAPENPYGYLWGAVFAAPGGSPGALEENPVKNEEKKVDRAFDPIKPPALEDLTPQKLADAAGEFARASQKVRQGKDKIKLLLLERIERSRAIGDLEKAKAKADTVFEVWACQYEDYLQAGDVVSTAEVPGHYKEPKGAEERPISLIPPLLNAGGLAPAEGLSAAGVFVNAALEPGHLRWRPVWRYGTILTLSNDSGGGWSGETNWSCSVRLAPADARMFDREPGAHSLNLQADELLANVPISYPPCNGWVFQAGDEVLVLFEGFSREKPKVIGFRRSPRLCPDGRVSWRG